MAAEQSQAVDLTSLRCEVEQLQRLLQAEKDRTVELGAVCNAMQCCVMLCDGIGSDELCLATLT